MENMDALTYEMLVRRAYSCDRYKKKGADADIFRGLEREKYLAKQSPGNGKLKNDYLNSLNEIKGFTVDALQQGINVLKKIKGSEGIISDMENLIIQSENAVCSLFTLLQINKKTVTGN
jgi:hypothetical protein